MTADAAPPDPDDPTRATSDHADGGGGPAPAATSNLTDADLLSITDHELGNLVATLAALCDRLERRWDQLSEDERRALTRRAAAQVAHLVTLLANLRALRHAGSFTDIGPAPPLDPQPDTTLRGLCEDLRLAAPDHDLVAVIDALPPARLDAARLAQVLRNLVLNSAKFAPAGTPITLHAWADGGWLHVTVDDAGPGVAPAQREAVFEKFVQLDPTHPGRGLGLFISRAIVDALDGRISITDAPNGGCRVELELPCRTGDTARLGPG